jgi:alpha-galactosidase
MTCEILREYQLGELTLRYVAAPDDRESVGLVLIPTVKLGEIQQRRANLDAAYIKTLPSKWRPMRAWTIEPMVQVHVRGDVVGGGFSSGRTMRGSASTRRLRWREQTVNSASGQTKITNILEDERGLEVVHLVAHQEGERAVTIQTAVANRGAAPLTLDMLSSFSVGGITPFDAADAPGRLRIHRFRSSWSAEGRPEGRSVEELNLERSWTGHGVRVEKFGQVGSLPVNGFFPFVGIEDVVAGVTWAATLACPGSWQMEIGRRADELTLSGGAADRDFGHWSKTLMPGESWEAPVATLTAVAGGSEEACDALLAPRRRTGQKKVPVGESEMPVVFNEWCTSWGNPNHNNLIALADRLQGSGVKYLVIDDGWAERLGSGIQQNGDWRVNRAAFPRGLQATTEAIRERGLVPGIWFELEVVNEGSKAWGETSHLLHRDGVPLQVGTRRFWDFRDAWVHDYLAERVIARVRDDGFGYLKVDYNDSIGIGCDGAESLGEGLREHLAGVQRFFARIREELPDLVIENCSSGGHRLEPSMMALTAMSSFSDAHETPDVPVIAANLHRLVLPEQSQIWCVVHASDTLQRISYSLAATFLGRMCLSGEVHELADEQWAFVCAGVTRYKESAAVIRTGRWRRFGARGQSYQHLTGWQAVVCVNEADGAALVVWHAFAQPPAVACVPWLHAKIRRIGAEFSDARCKPVIEGHELSWQMGREWSGGVFLLGR